MRARKTAFALQAIVVLGSGVGVGVALQSPSPGEKKFANDAEGEFTEFTDKTVEEDVDNGPGDGYELQARSASFHQEMKKALCPANVKVDEYHDCLPCMVWLADKGEGCSACRLCLGRQQIEDECDASCEADACDWTGSKNNAWATACSIFARKNKAENCFPERCYTSVSTLFTPLPRLADKANWLLGRKDQLWMAPAFASAVEVEPNGLALQAMASSEKKRTVGDAQCLSCIMKI
eukprot:g2342.t1